MAQGADEKKGKASVAERVEPLISVGSDVASELVLRNVANPHISRLLGVYFGLPAAALRWGVETAHARRMGHPNPAAYAGVQVFSETAISALLPPPVNALMSLDAVLEGAFPESYAAGKRQLDQMEQLVDGPRRRDGESPFDYMLRRTGERTLEESVRAGRMPGQLRTASHQAGVAAADHVVSPLPESVPVHGPMLDRPWYPATRGGIWQGGVFYPDSPVVQVIPVLDMPDFGHILLNDGDEKPSDFKPKVIMLPEDIDGESSADMAVDSEAGSSEAVNEKRQLERGYRSSFSASSSRDSAPESHAPHLPALGEFQPSFEFSWDSTGLKVCVAIGVSNPSLYLPMLIGGGLLVAGGLVYSHIDHKRRERAMDFQNRAYDHFMELVSGGRDSRGIVWSGLAQGCEERYHEILKMTDPGARKHALLDFGNHVQNVLRHFGLKMSEDNERADNCNKHYKGTVQQNTNELHQIYEQEVMPHLRSLQRGALICAAMGDRAELMKLHDDPQFANEQDEIEAWVCCLDIGKAYHEGDYTETLSLCENLPDSHAEYGDHYSHQARKGKIDTAAEAELVELAADPEYAENPEYLACIHKCEDGYTKQRVLRLLLGEEQDFAAAEGACAQFHDPKLQARYGGVVDKCRHDHDLPSLVDLLEERYQSAVTAERTNVEVLESVVKQSRQLLADLADLKTRSDDADTLVYCDRETKTINQNIANCYLRLNKDTEAIQHVEDSLLAADPEDLSGLCIKAQAKQNLEQKTEARELFYKVLSLDAGHSVAHRCLAQGYAKDLDAAIKVWEAQSHSHSVFSKIAVSLDGQTEVDRAVAEDDHLVMEISTGVAKLKEHIGALKARAAASDAATGDVVKVDESLDALVKYADGTEKYAQDVVLEKNQFYHRFQRSFVSRVHLFQAQSSQIVADGLFYAAEWLMADGSVLPKNLLTGGRQFTMNMLALNAHAWQGQISTLMRDRDPTRLEISLHGSRAVLLGTKAMRGVLEVIVALPGSDDAPRRIAGFLDEYAFPVGQLATSVGYMLNDSRNIVAGLASFAPEGLLHIPEVRSGLLGPDPEANFAYARFAVGRALENLASGGPLSSAVAGLGYVSAYSETLSGWAQILAESAGYADAALVRIPAGVATVYTVLRLAQSVYAIGRTAYSLEQDWQRYCVPFVLQRAQALVARGEREPARRLFAEVTTTFRRIKRDWLSATERTQQTLALLHQHQLAGRVRPYPVSDDGNCLFSAIAMYTEQDAATLRRLAMTYIETHRAEFEPSIGRGRFNAYIRSLRRDGRWGGEIEIRALEQVLKRPIVVLNSRRGIDGCLVKEPIFVLYNGVNHYHAVIVPETSILRLHCAGILAHYRRHKVEQERQLEPLRARRNALLAAFPAVRAHVEAAQVALVGEVGEAPAGDAPLAARAQHVVGRRAVLKGTVAELQERLAVAAHPPAAEVEQQPAVSIETLREQKEDVLAARPEVRARVAAGTAVIQAEIGGEPAEDASLAVRAQYALRRRSALETANWHLHEVQAPDPDPDPDSGVEGTRPIVPIETLRARRDAFLAANPALRGRLAALRGNHPAREPAAADAGIAARMQQVGRCIEGLEAGCEDLRRGLPTVWRNQFGRGGVGLGGASAVADYG